MIKTLLQAFSFKLNRLVRRGATVRLEVLFGSRQMVARRNCMVTLRGKHRFVFSPQ